MENTSLRGMTIFTLAMLVLAATCLPASAQTTPPAPVNPYSNADPSKPNAEAKTLITDSGLESGGYGAFELKVSQVAQTAGLLAGARGGWIINHSYAIGVSGLGLATPAYTPANLGMPNYQLGFGYGGVFFDYIFLPMSVVHGYVGVLLGAGGAGWYTSNQDYYYTTNSGFTPFFVAEPEIGMEINVAPVFRIGIHASYRFTSAFNQYAVSADDVRGFSGSLLFKFGVF